jgi:GntR family transcriptional regulator / MocR family aminotransferase
MTKTTVVPIKLESSHRTTLQEQIYSSIRCSILEGLIGADHRLPSTRALAAELGVSRTTVMGALEHLQAEGYLVTRRGSGTYIAKQLPDRAAPLPLQHARGGRHPLLSERGRALAEARAPDRRRPVSPRAFRLGTPALDLFPLRLWSRIARQCIRSATAKHLDYSALSGLMPLRVAIAEQLRSRGTKCEPSQVTVVAGSQRGLDLVFHLLLDPGDSAWVEEPGYPGARCALLAAGAHALPMSVDADGMRLSEEPDADNVRLAYVTPSHQFPLGVTMSLERRRELLQWARRSRTWIVEDDYDCEFRYQTQPRPCLHALDPDGRVIYVGSFSKNLFPALRLGFLIVPHDLATGFATARRASDMHPPVLEQLVLAEFISRGHYQRHLRRMQAAYSERLDALQTAIQRSGVPLKLRPVHSGLHAVADVEDGIDAERVAQEAEARDLEVVPLSHYYYGTRAPENALLLGFGAIRPAAIRLGVSHLAQALDAARRN